MLLVQRMTTDGFAPIASELSIRCLKKLHLLDEARH